VLKVGLTGGVASGKSTLAAMLGELGAVLCDADAVVGELYRPGAPGSAAVEGAFGRAALAPDGGVDRAALARLVLDDAAARRRLEGAVHPLVRAAIAEWFAALARDAAPPAVAVVEAALLVETGVYREQDRLVVTTAPREVRRTRALAAGWAAERFEGVVAAQLDDAAREAVADYVVRNDGGRESLRRAAAALWGHLAEDARIVAAGGALRRERVVI